MTYRGKGILDYVFYKKLLVKIENSTLTKLLKITRKSRVMQWVRSRQPLGNLSEMGGSPQAPEEGCEGESGNAVPRDRTLDEGRAEYHSAVMDKEIGNLRREGEGKRFVHENML